METQTVEVYVYVNIDLWTKNRLLMLNIRYAMDLPPSPPQAFQSSSYKKGFLDSIFSTARFSCVR